MSYENNLKRIGKRDWGTLQERWLGEISKLSFSHPGMAPAFPVEDIPALRAQLAAAPKTGELRAEVANIRAPIIHEAFYLLHKSANVLVAAHDQVVGGVPTWSLSTGYQSALFAAEAVLRLLGIAIVALPKKSFTLDAWPPAPPALSKTKLASYGAGIEVQIVQYDNISHFHRWAILQRVLRVTSGIGFDGELLNALGDLGDHDFAEQRNKLHYSHTWMFDDLHAYLASPDCFSFKTKSELMTNLTPEAEGFGIALGTTVFALGMRLLKDLADASTLVAAERTLLLAACTEPRMKLRSAFEAGSGCTFA